MKMMKILPKIMLDPITESIKFQLNMIFDILVVKPKSGCNHCTVVELDGIAYADDVYLGNDST